MKKRIFAVLASAVILAASVIPAASAQKSIMGDVNGNGIVEALDARLALRASVGLEELSSSQMICADMDGDAKVTAADARNILRTAVGLPVSLPDKETVWLFKEYSYDFESLANMFDYKVEFEYYPDGNLKSVETIGPGDTERYAEYTYDEYGRILTEADDNGNRAENRYDENGNRISVTFYDQGIPTGCYTAYEYDERGNIVAENSYVDGGLVERTVITYDENNNVLTRRSEDYTDGSFNENSFEYVYDDKNNVIRQKFYSDSEVVSTSEYKYDIFGRLTESVTDSHGRVNTICYSYDADGNIVRLVACIGGIYSDATVRYDKHGNMTEEIVTNAYGQVLSKITFKYTSVRVSPAQAEKLRNDMNRMIGAQALTDGLHG